MKDDCFAVAEVERSDRHSLSGIFFYEKSPQGQLVDDQIFLGNTNQRDKNIPKACSLTIRSFCGIRIKGGTVIRKRNS